MSYETCFPETDIERVEFYLMSSDDHAQASSCSIISKDLFNSDRPVDNGIHSLSMGTTSYSFKCKTCLNPRDQCVGHPGSVQLRMPVTNPLFRSEIIKCLRTICVKCGSMLGKMTDEGFKSISTSTKSPTCPSCKFDQPTISKDPKDSMIILKKYPDGESVRMMNDEIEAIFSRVSDETANAITNGRYHPKALVLRTVGVVPNNARPDVRKVRSSTRSNNNDITTFVRNIVATNETLPIVISEEDKKAMEPNWDLLEFTFNNMIKEPSGTAATSRFVGGNGQSLMSLGGRLKGKEGRIRGNLEGKRIQYGARAVITCDTFIGINEVGIPESIAKVLQVVETVRPYNIEKMNILLANGVNAKEGITKIVKADTGSTYHVSLMNKDMKLEYGDTVYRNLMDGDVVAMNRAPSLLYSAITGHRVRILPGGDTFRLSVNVADTLYGGDFDGDAMGAYLPQSLISRNECGTLSSLEERFISYKGRQEPSMGGYHDAAIGLHLLTKSGVVADRFHTMRMLSQVKYENYLYKFKPLPEGNLIDSRSIISLLLPDINYKKRAGFYKQEYESFIKYDPKETTVIVERGVLKQGRFDKKSIGQGVSDSIFHAIYLAYGSHAAIDAIYNIQSVAMNYLLQRGFTINYDDFAIKKDTLKRIDAITSSILHQSDQLTKKYRMGLITPPIGKTVAEFYEEEQMSILSPGDEFTEVVMSSLDHERNNLVKLVMSGTKGKPTNILQISSSIGQMSINGKRMKRTFGPGRALPYARRFHDEPEAVGFIPNSFVTGVAPINSIAQQQDGRNGIANKALSTGIAGFHNRKANKALEAIITDNHRRAVKYNMIVQLLCGDDAVDLRKTMNVDFSILLASDTKFNDMFSTENVFSELPKQFKNETMKSVLVDTEKHLLNVRSKYREFTMRNESINFKDVPVNDTQALPTNPLKELNNVVYYHGSESRGLLSPLEWKEHMTLLKNRLQYVYYNEQYEKRGAPIPNHIVKSLTLMYMAVDIGLCYKNMIKNNIDTVLFQLIVDRILSTYKRSLVEYGVSVGMLASQCTSESMTQRILDSIHSSGASNTNFLTRNKEVYGAKGTAQMHMPYMDIFVQKEFENDIAAMQRIANEIEMMDLKTFVHRAQVFHEHYGNVIHPEYKEEGSKIFKLFERHHLQNQAPKNLLKWCVRLELSHMIMIEKSMTIDMIYRKLCAVYPSMHIIYTDDNADKIVMRLYFKRDFFKKDVLTIDQHVIYDILKKDILKTIIRGIIGVTSAKVLKEFVPRTVIDSDGSTKVVRANIIRTMGTNLAEIVKHRAVDPTRTISNSIIEVHQILGIYAARAKLIQALKEISGSDINIKHYTLIADTLTWNGYLSSIERSGVLESNPGNALLAMSYSHPLQSITEAALNKDTSYVTTNISSSLLLGTTPNIGSNYNRIIVNEDFVSKETKKTSDLLVDI